MLKGLTPDDDLLPILDGCCDDFESLGAQSNPAIPEGGRDYVLSGKMIDGA